MIQALSYGGYEYVIIFLEKVLATEKFNGIGSFVEVNLEHTDAHENKTRYCPSYPESN